MADLLIRKQLKEPFLEQAIQDTNFFNGRLLTAEALSTLQKASHQRIELLGQAAGSGVVSGLEVALLSDGSDGAPPVVSVAKGLAINRLGQPILLPLDAEVALAQDQPGQVPTAGFFNICLPDQQNGQPLPGKGAYIFAIRPFVDWKGYAPRRGFGQAAKVEDCDRDLLVEGVQFRLVELDINLLTALSTETRQAVITLLGKGDLISLNKLRNWLAHLCFGTEELPGFLSDPFARLGGVSPEASYGAIDALRGEGLLDDCDVPLALLCWTNSGVKFVDMWSARRRLVPLDSGTLWPLPFSGRRMAEGEAAFYQFQDQVETLINTATNASAVNLLIGKDNFRYLPPCGYLPLVGPKTSFGFNAQRFFMGTKVRDPLTKPIYIQGAEVIPLVNELLAYPAIDLNSPELIWLYRVHENQVAVDTGIPAVARPYLLFANGHIPYRGNARYDLAYWNYSNFA